MLLTMDCGGGVLLYKHKQKLSVHVIMSLKQNRLKSFYKFVDSKKIEKKNLCLVGKDM